MIKLNNITFAQYVELEESQDYDYAINYAYTFNKPVDHYKVGDIMQLPFGLVKDLQFDMQEGLTWLQFTEYMVKLSNKNIGNEKLLEVCQQRSFIIKAMEELIEVEKISLSGNSTGDEDEAGIDEFKNFGIEMQIRNLTKGDVTKKEHVRNIPYEDCFVELVISKKLSDYEENLNKIRNRKNNS